jgi:hypothetical protein
MNSTLVRLAASQLPGGGDCSSLNTQWWSALGECEI